MLSLLWSLSMDPNYSRWQIILTSRSSRTSPIYQAVWISNWQSEFTSKATFVASTQNSLEKLLIPISLAVRKQGEVLRRISGSVALSVYASKCIDGAMNHSGCCAVSSIPDIVIVQFLQWGVWDLAVDHIISRFSTICYRSFDIEVHVNCNPPWDCHCAKFHSRCKAPRLDICETVAIFMNSNSCCSLLPNYIHCNKMWT